MDIFRIGYTERVTVRDMVGNEVLCYDVLRKARQQKQHLSIARVANHLHINKSVLAKYERGVALPKTWFILKQLCLILSLSADDLLGISDKYKNDTINSYLISTYRKYNKLSIRQLSAKLGKSATASSHYETNTPLSTWLTLKHLCTFLNISANTLLGIEVTTEIIDNTTLKEFISLYKD